MEANASLLAIRRALGNNNVNGAVLGPFPNQGVFTFITDKRRSTDEVRLLYVRSSGGADSRFSNSDRQASFYGFGAGLATTRKWIDNRHVVMGASLGSQFMWYRLALTPVVPLNAAIANPAATTTIRLRQGFYADGVVALNLDIRFGRLKNVCDEVRASTRLGYLFPLVAGKVWSYDNGQVPTLPAFRSGMPCVQFGLIFLNPARRG